MPGGVHRIPTNPTLQMKINPVIAEIIVKLSTEYHNILKEGNRASAGSRKFNKARVEADKIEKAASMLVFGDMNHNVFECERMVNGIN